MEFGGPIGCALIIVFSHIIPYYLWYCVEYCGSNVTAPSLQMVEHLLKVAQPTLKGTSIYLGFISFEAILASFIPGFISYGLPLKHQGNKKLQYNCNAIQSWYITLAVALVLHFTGLFRITELIDNYAPILTCAILFADFVSVATYIITIANNRQYMMSGNLLYDFFMGAALNPRIGSLDIKMFSEARISWIWLFLFTCSAASKQYDVIGYVSMPMIFLITAQGLYTNAIMKGEEAIVSTWDIFHEKYGWMLCYWNLAGVPFVYCIQAFYLAKKSEPVHHSSTMMVFMFSLLFIAYYIWDTSQSQRNFFRQKLEGTWKPRYTFPQLPGCVIENPKYLNTKAGSKLLIDGWWGIVRKPHYSADIVMALLWGVCCGYQHAIPYFYFCFFFVMIMHRANRDISRCSKKYGSDWDTYRQHVPYLFIPYIF
ncbi:ergosterol biosynthesis protein [Acrasis kona]|uniref:Delta(24(24(1)))-sterol reductase n=1 Tax=Acrasis kona TaxID=1008807 RepID=A0AAW2YP37_9EUKA